MINCELLWISWPLIISTVLSSVFMLDINNFLAVSTTGSLFSILLFIIFLFLLKLEISWAKVTLKSCNPLNPIFFENLVIVASPILLSLAIWDIGL